MIAPPAIAAIFIVLVTFVIKWGLRIVNWIWLTPKNLEKCLREQGLQGNSYRFLFGDMKDLYRMTMEAKSEHIKVTDDIVPYALRYFDYIINKHGKKSFIWVGPCPRLNIVEPELIKEVLSKPDIFPKPNPEPLRDAMVGGLLTTEGEKWVKHRRMINPAFHLEKLKNMLPAIHASCHEMISNWEMLVPKGDSYEVDVFPYLDDLSGDVISRTAFGSNHAEGKRIFELQKEQVNLLGQLFMLVFIPGWRFIPIKSVKRFKEIESELATLLRGIINKRQKRMQNEEVKNDDLLGILLESNSSEIKESGFGMSIEDVIEECKLFYFAGSETTSNLLAWTMILLSMHPNWQMQARNEVLQVFGNRKPDFDGLNHLKIVTMIFHEVLRLYPPVVLLIRAITKETKLGNMTLPAGMEVTLPIMVLHHDPEIWGEDAAAFRPERFSDGIFSATKGKFTYLPFAGGPRICIGQNFAMIEAKVAMAMILQRFSFEISPSYKHSPFPVFTLPPQFGAQIILQKI